jgi:hypothetical protein
MRKRKYKLLIFVIIIPLFMDFRCGKDPEVTFQNDFVEKIDLFPAQKTYHIGDTVWVQYVNADNKFLDIRTSQRILADSLSVIFQVSLNAQYNTAVNPVAGFCDFVTPAGVNAGRSLGHFGTGTYQTFGCGTGNNYNFKIGIVFKEKGIFTVELTQERQVIRCSNRVNSFPNSTLEYEFNFADGNKDIYLSIPLATRGGNSASGYTERRIDEKKVFVLRVD